MDMGGQIRGTLLRDEPMRRHTSWRVGGPAEIYFKPADLADLQTFLANLDPSTPVTWVGLGSNLLVRDGGIAGAVIATHGVLKTMRRMGDGGVYAEAGIACARIARQCALWSLGPAEFFAGIPGTLGGALAMNAGAYGGETWDHVRAVRTLDRSGILHERGREQFDIGYRHVSGPGEEWYVAAEFVFEQQTGASLDGIRDLLARRKATQPIGLPSCGSVFRNPPGDHAARLIEEAGLKGMQKGGARVSDKHANFIINAGGASAADVERLIETVRQRVAEQFGVELVHEVRIVGRPA
ncbi:MAG: UDP-N-acetylmuramate dehydrogenase [Gammaproteobacteria bacterium]